MKILNTVGQFLFYKSLSVFEILSIMLISALGGGWWWLLLPVIFVASAVMEAVLDDQED